jgi:glutamate dehydrogenase (NAD(P)+)
MTLNAHPPNPASPAAANGPQPPFLQVEWHDQESAARGWVVIDRLVAGIATGGTRMRPGCTATEVTDLAREMSLKMGIYGIHVGGAKGGIDFDPAHPDAPAVRRRFVQAVRPLLESCWVTAGDLGTPQELLDTAFAEAGVGNSSLHAALIRAADPAQARARVAAAFSERVDGLVLADLVGGYGVAESALAGLEELGITPSGATAVIQGFGAMGGSTALYLSRAGVKVIGIADAAGLVLNTERGLDVERLLQTRSRNGGIDRSALRADDREAPGGDWLSMDADLLVPAAASYVITAGNCGDITARLIAEAANVATSAEAEQLLLERGTVVIPDFIANTGAAAGAWWVILGQVDGPAAACERLSGQVRPLVKQLTATAAREGTSLRTEAISAARARIAELSAEYGSVVPERDLYS